jgi:hypothetical protein
MAAGLNMVTTLDIAWAAGFLEGEGSFVANRGTPVVVCPQVQREPLDRLQRMFGGTIYLQDRGNPKHQPCHIWRLNGFPAAGLMMTLLALLSPKRVGQVKAALFAWYFSPGSGHLRYKTHCPHGHEYTPENTRVYRGSRNCRKCGTEHSKEWRRAKVAQMKG